MQDKSDEYALRLSYLEQADANSLAVARLYLEMASGQHYRDREYALSLFDKAELIAGVGHSARKVVLVRKGMGKKTYISDYETSN